MAEETKQDVFNDSQNALVEIDTTSLNQESLKLLNELIAENDLDKAKDLTYLFNINQNKKTMVRLDKLSELQDNLVAQFSKRIAERPDEISNQELVNSIKTIQDIIERGQKQVSGVDEQKPLIQINQQTNNVNDDGLHKFTKDSRDRIKNVVYSVLSDLERAQEDAIEVTPIEDEDND